jgi:hypothetical protein
LNYTYSIVKIKYRECDISISNLRLNHESMEWHCDICLTIHAEDTLDMKNTHTFAVYSEEEALEAAKDWAMEHLDSILPEK